MIKIKQLSEKPGIIHVAVTMIDAVVAVAMRDAVLMLVAAAMKDVVMMVVAMAMRDVAMMVVAMAMRDVAMTVVAAAMIVVNDGCCCGDGSC